MAGRTRLRSLACTAVLLATMVSFGSALQAGQDGATPGGGSAVAPMTMNVAGAPSSLLAGSDDAIAGQVLPMADLRPSYAAAGYKPIWTTDGVPAPAAAPSASPAGSTTSGSSKSGHKS